MDKKRFILTPQANFVDFVIYIENRETNKQF